MRKFKKVLCVLLTGAMLIGAAGCGKKDDSGSSGAASVKDTANYTFAEDTGFEITGFQGSADSFHVSGDKIFFQTYEWVNEGGDESSPTDSESDEEFYADGYSVNRIYEAPVSGGEATEIGTPDVSDEEYINSILAKDGGLYGVITIKYSESGSSYYLYQYSNGSFGEAQDLTKKLGMDSDEYLSSVYVSSAGNFVVCFEQRIVVLDENWNEISTFDEGEYIPAVGLDKDGKIIIAHETYENEETKTTIRIYDPEKKTTTDEYPVDVSYFAGSQSIITGSGQYDFYYQTSNSVYGYKYADKSSTKIIDFSGSDLPTDYISNVTMVDENTMLLNLWQMEEDNNSGIKKYTKVDPSEVANRVVLTYASLWGNYDMKNAIVAYNKSQSKYRINMVDYSEENDPEAKMAADIAAGNLPDIYDLSNGVGGMSVDQCIAKGMFEDLMPYLEKDPELNESDFVPSAFNSLKHDGKLYTVSPSFSIYTLMGRGSEIGTEPGWTFEEMKDYVESKGEDTTMFYSTNKSDNLNEFMYGCVSDFVDWDSGKCYFDTQDFKDILIMCNRGSNDEMEWGEDYDTASMIRNGDMLFLEGSVNPEELQMYNQLFDGDISFKGYPNAEKQGTFFNFTSMVAISSKCENKDAAWDFIRTVLTEEYQSKHYTDMYNVPIREDVYEAYQTYAMNTKEGFIDKYGNEINPIDMGYSWGDVEIQIKPLSQEEMDEFRAMVESASGVWSYDNSLQEIISEEAMAYFKGEKSVDDVAAIIQNRATTYVNENR